MTFDYLTAEDFDRIRRTQGVQRGPVRRLALDPEITRGIRVGGMSYTEAMRRLYPHGLRVRLDAPMQHTFQRLRAPDVGETGTMLYVDGGGGWIMRWDNSSNLKLLPGQDEFTVLGPADPDQDECGGAEERR